RSSRCRRRCAPGISVVIRDGHDRRNERHPARFGSRAPRQRPSLVAAMAMSDVTPPPLEILPSRTAGAAENMAIDFLLLQRHPRPTAPRFRHYGWRSPAFTFGYGQKIAFVREQLPPGEVFDLCRRPTGGGVVDHRDDWTYALVLPRGHPLEELRATSSYRAVHEALAGALR